MSKPLQFEGFRVPIPRSVTAALDAVRAGSAEYGAHQYRLREVWPGDGSVLLDFAPALFVESPRVAEARPIVMDDGEPREDEYMLSWELDSLPSLGDVHATLEKLHATKLGLVIDDIDVFRGSLDFFIWDPFAVPPIGTLLEDEQPPAWGVPLDD
jgi:hypothetical protein